MDEIHARLDRMDAQARATPAWDVQVAEFLADCTRADPDGRLYSVELRAAFVEYAKTRGWADISIVGAQTFWVGVNRVYPRLRKVDDRRGIEYGGGVLSPPG